jgi:hypothetical protein
MAPKSRPDLQRVNEKKTNHGDVSLFKQGGQIMATKMNPAFAAMIEKKKAGAGDKKPAGKPFAKGGGIESKGKTKGKNIVMKKGGMAKGMC